MITEINVMRRIALAALLGAVSFVIGGCSSYSSDAKLMNAMERGNFSFARVRAIDTAGAKPTDRSYILGREKIVLASLAEGVPQATEGNVDRVYDFLRTQGVNEGAGIGAFFSTESNATFWKGEPFEQAMAYAYIAAFDGLNGDWGNVRASASNSIFLIRDFSEAIRRGQEVREQEGAPSDALAEREAVIADLESRNPDNDDNPEWEFDLVESDFELGYLLKAIGADQLGDLQSRDEDLRSLTTLSSRFDDMSRQVRAGSYNTVVMVSYGLGPEKYGDGPDNAIEMYRALTRSDNAPLVVSGPSGSQRFPLATDVNRLAMDTRWTNLEGMRRAKSAIGTGMVVAGAVVMATADSTEQLVAGAIVTGIGALFKASAGADTRYLEIMPQRTYLALLDLPEGGGYDLTFEIEGKPGTALRLPAVPAPRSTGDDAIFHYVRLSDGRGEPWRTSGNVYYANDAMGMPDGPTLPWIMGGRCVRTPVPGLMDEYYAAGLPQDVSYDDLLEVYREEGIVISGITVGADLRRHALEGGNALYTPAACSAGFMRLFGREYGAYAPRGALLNDVLNRMNGGDSSPNLFGS